MQQVNNTKLRAVFTAKQHPESNKNTMWPQNRLWLADLLPKNYAQPYLVRSNQAISSGGVLLPWRTRDAPHHCRNTTLGPMIFRDRGKWTEIAETTVWNGIEQMTWKLRFLLNFLPNSWPKPAKTFKKAEDFEDFQGWRHLSWLFVSWKFIGWPFWCPTLWANQQLCCLTQ